MSVREDKIFEIPHSIMADIITKKGLEAVHMRVVEEKDTYRAIHPTFLSKKRPGKYRDVINFKKELSQWNRWGRANLTFNEMPPLDYRVPHATIYGQYGGQQEKN